MKPQISQITQINKLFYFPVFYIFEKLLLRQIFMETIQIYKTLKEDGEIYINNIPYKKGSKVILM